MCGFAGVLGQAGLGQEDRAALAAMSPRIEHRGPDAGEVWFDEAGIGLLHRRLAIIDLSPAGAQPMMSAGGRYVIAYNGEIYNFADIRVELDAGDGAPQWRGHSDTEVLLAAIERWGIGPALRRAEGMFAFALWDRASRQLTLARDRLGEKPLYYGWQGTGAARRLLFGSDLTALRVHPAFAGEIDREAVASLCRLLYIAEPRSVYRGIAKLTPGTFVVIDQASGEERHETYFDLAASALAARRRPFSGSHEVAVDALEGVLTSAIERQMVSDVPLGAFLSGGIDSTTVVALMQKVSAAPVKTFTIGFPEERYDEAGYARAVARHLGTEHHELYVQPGDALDVIPQLPSIYSEPFADSSQIPTFLVSQLARQHVTVALSGDGGDEAFGGYNRHLFAHRTWPALARVPRPLRAAAGRLLHAVPPATWDLLLGQLVSASLVGDKVHKVAQLLASGSDEALYESLIAVNPGSGDLLEPAVAQEGAAAPPIDAAFSLAEMMMLRDSLGYLPGDILVKVDRAAMANSLETRVPFLDPRVIDFAWSLPIETKIHDGRTKWPLRALLDRHIPGKLVERPKMGFGLPLGEWLRGPLRAWAECMLDPRGIREGGLFDPAAVGRLWALHLSCARNVEHRLWPVLMTQAWLEDQRGNGAVGPAA